MEILEAVVKSIRSYYDGEGLNKTNETVAGDTTDKEGITYTKEYFDDFEKQAKGEGDVNLGDLKEAPDEDE